MPLDVLAARVLQHCRENGWMLATAESCTGGLIASTLTDVAGSSDAVDRGFVTYSNEAKIEMLGVPVELIAEYGAVSEPVARAMAEEALARSNAHIAVSCTGIAGPAGGSDEKPVGTVHLACALKGGEMHHAHCVFKGDRAAVREMTVEKALEMILER